MVGFWIIWTGKTSDDEVYELNVLDCFFWISALILFFFTLTIRIKLGYTYNQLFPFFANGGEHYDGPQD